MTHHWMDWKQIKQKWTFLHKPAFRHRTITGAIGLTILHTSSRTVKILLGFEMHWFGVTMMHQFSIVRQFQDLHMVLGRVDTNIKAVGTVPGLSGLQILIMPVRIHKCTRNNKCSEWFRTMEEFNPTLLKKMLTIPVNMRSLPGRIQIKFPKRFAAYHSFWLPTCAINENSKM